MVDYINKLYTSINSRNEILEKIWFYKVQRFFIRLLINLIIPIYYSLSKNASDIKLIKNDLLEGRLIVSLTTFPARISRIWMVIESILRQQKKPDMIILWLSKDQFGSKDILPKKLLNQQKRGLTIRFCDGDIKSHKKYYYALKEFPEDFLITVDDDIIYPTTLVSQLLELNKEYPNSICCHRAKIIETEGSRLLPYKSWPEAKRFIAPCNNLFLTSGGGTLFPPHSLNKEVFNEAVFRIYCFLADDVWLNIMARLNKTTIVKSDYYSSLLPVLNFNDVHLYSGNLFLNGNDIQLENTRSYYIKNLGIDTFDELLFD